jgi:hypothetical protein
MLAYHRVIYIYGSFLGTFHTFKVRSISLLYLSVNIFPRLPPTRTARKIQKINVEPGVRTLTLSHRGLASNHWNTYLFVFYKR